MVINVPPDLEIALAAQATQRGIAPEALVLDILQRQLLSPAPFVPIDDWERELFAAAVDCEISVPDEALSRERLYE